MIQLNETDLKNFYPTPDNIIKKMIEGLNISKDTKILEPSAGKGNILDYIVKYTDVSIDNIDCIEIDDNLKCILRNKGYSVINSDFLRCLPEKSYNYIIMNPPFDRGVHHLLHALEIRKNAGIVCLLNSNTLENINNKYKERLKALLEINNAEIISLGNCFNDSIRSTDVNVIMIKVPELSKNKSNDYFDNLHYEQDFDFNEMNVDIFSNNQENNLTITNKIETIVNQYEKVKLKTFELLKILKELRFYGNGISDSDTVSVLVESLIKNRQPESALNVFISNFKKSCWNDLINKTKFNELLTQKTRGQFIEKIQEQSSLCFTVDNIEKTILALYQNQNKIIKDCIIEVFDTLTKYYNDNRCYEGWKTNDQFRVKDKVIIPITLRDYYGGTVSPNPVLQYTSKLKLMDIEKAMCFVAGIKYDDIKGQRIEDKIKVPSKETVNETENFTYSLNYGKWYDSYFFEFKIYKKETIHLKFKDKYIYEKFNLIACEGKNWIMPSRNK